MSKNKSTVPLGTILEGKLRLIREIGRGGMAAVYEAENIDIGKRVAVKVLAAELITSRVVRERFIREARAAAAIRSPHICDVYDCGMYEERPFLVMELLEGESLYDLMSRERQLGRALTLNIARQTARGLQKAHDSGIIHRDLKPENIFLTKGEEGELVAKIVDFGLARFYEPIGGGREASRLTREGALFGTPAYMSPEQSKGQGGADHRCDLWALGCIVYECVTGQTVWNIDDGVAMIFAQIAGAPIPRASRLRPDLGPSFDRWFSKALERDPNQRFQTARQFADELGEALDGPESVRAPTVPRPGPATREVDELLSRPVIARVPGITFETPLAPLTSVGAQPARFEQHTEPGVAPESTLPPPGGRSRGGAWRAIGFLLLAATTALGAYAVWLYGVNPPSRTGSSTSPATEKPGKDAQPPGGEADSFALQIGAAQAWLEKGDLQNAQTMFNEAFQNGGDAVARSLLSHAKSIGDGSEGSCKVSGLGRPRPFDRVKPSSRPSITVGRAGAVVAWVDAIDAGQQVQTVLLDSALRRSNTATSVTPSARSARQPHLLSYPGGLAVTYWDPSGDPPGLWVQRLTLSGVADGAPIELASGRHQFDVSVASSGDTFWSVWEEQIEPDRTDLMVRPLDQTLAPTRAAVRIASLYRAGSNIEALASRPDIAVEAGQLHVVFTANRTAAHHQTMLLRVRLDDPALVTGLADAPALTKAAAADKPASKTAAGIKANASNQKRSPSLATSQNGSTARGRGPASKATTGGTKETLPDEQGAFPDRSVGTLIALSKPLGKHAQPRIVCVTTACIVAWDEENAGAHVALLAPDKQEVVWQQTLGESSVRPGLAVAPWGQVAIVWYEDSRVLWTSVGRDGVGKGSPLTRVSGHQPYPAIAAGLKRGEWWVAFRDFEAAHFESFVVRAQCPDVPVLQ